MMTMKVFFMICCLVVVDATIEFLVPCSNCNKQEILQKQVCTLDEKLSENDLAIPPPAPFKISSSWYIYSNSNGAKSVAFNVNWMHKSQDVLLNLTGYKLEVRVDNAILKNIYFSFNKDLLPKTVFDSGSKQTVLLMNYDCFGVDEDFLLNPGKEYLLSISSLSGASSSYDISSSVYIPDCTDDDNSNIAEMCITSTPGVVTQYTDNITSIQTNTVLTPIVIGSITALILVSFLTYVYVTYCRRQVDCNRKVLLVCNANHVSRDRSLWCQVDKLARDLKNRGVEVTSNLWESTLVAEQPYCWIRKNALDSDCIVFVLSSMARSESDRLNETFEIALKAVKSIIDEEKFRPDIVSVSFGRTPSPEFSLPARNVTYLLPKEEKKFLLQMTKIAPKDITLA